jgi:hypothetical protein
MHGVASKTYDFAKVVAERGRFPFALWQTGRVSCFQKNAVVYFEGEQF